MALHSSGKFSLSSLWDGGGAALEEELDGPDTIVVDPIVFGQKNIVFGHPAK